MWSGTPSNTRVRQVPHTPCSHDTGSSIPWAASAATTLWSAATGMVRPLRANRTSKAPSSADACTVFEKRSKRTCSSAQPAARAAAVTASRKRSGPQT